MKKQHVVQVPFLLIIIFLAIFSDWEYDEAWTFMAVKDNSLKELLSYYPYYYANNHIINSTWFLLLIKVFGTHHPFFFRLLSIISFFVYAHYIIKVVEYKAAKIIDIWAVIFFLLPYIGFFALGRGYAMAIACFVAAYYYFEVYHKDRYVTTYLLFVVFGTVASLALFSFMFGVAAMFALILFYELSGALKKTIHHSSKDVALKLAISLIFGVALVYIYYCGKIINEYDKNIIGAESLLVNGTVSSIISYLSLQDFVSLKWFSIIRLVFMGSLLPVIYIFIKNKLLSKEVIVIAVSLLLIVVSHYAFGSLYPMSRSVTYIIALFYIRVYIYYLKDKKLFFYSHFAVLLATGGIVIFLLVQSALLKSGSEALEFMMGKGNTTLYMDSKNDNITIYNEQVYNSKVNVVRLGNAYAFIENLPQVQYCLVERDQVIEVLAKDKAYEEVMRTQAGVLYKKNQ